MEEQTDQTVIKNMGIVLVILVVFTNNPGAIASTEERIKPVADAYTGDEGPAPAEAAPAAAPTQAVAFDGSLDAEMIYNSVCAACHGTGVAGAPKPGSPEMAQRVEKGADTLMQTVLNGLNAMPARGGRADLSDAQLQVVVEFMTQ